MLCPVISIGRQEKECEETKCTFWYKNECVVAGYLRTFIRGEAPERDEPGM